MKQKIKKVILISAISSVLFTGCVSNVSEDNKNESKNNFDKYVITRISGGKIMDVWKIEKSENICRGFYYDSTNYNFKDNKGNEYNVPASETTIIKCNDDEIWNSYAEYHWNENIVENNDKN